MGKYMVGGLLFVIESSFCGFSPFTLLEVLFFFFFFFF